MRVKFGLLISSAVNPFLKHPSYNHSIPLKMLLRSSHVLSRAARASTRMVPLAASSFVATRDLSTEQLGAIYEAVIIAGSIGGAVAGGIEASSLWRPTFGQVVEESLKGFMAGFFGSVFSPFWVPPVTIGTAAGYAALQFRKFDEHGQKMS
jgi:hypothetical protein